MQADLVDWAAMYGFQTAVIEGYQNMINLYMLLSALVLAIALPALTETTTPDFEDNDLYPTWIVISTVGALLFFLQIIVGQALYDCVTR